MKAYLIENAFKLIAIAAVLNILTVLIREFGIPAIVDMQLSIKYSQRLVAAAVILDIIATIFFWLAIGSIAALVDGMYRERRD